MDKSKLKYVGKTMLYLLSAGISAYQLFKTLRILEELDNEYKKQ